MAADFIGRSGRHVTIFYSDLLDLQDIAKLVGIPLEMDIEYSKEQATKLYKKLLEHKDKVHKDVLKFLKQCDGFILY